MTASPSPAADLPLTGERTVPGVPAENYWFRRHEVAYEYVAGLVPSRSTVVEVGCGEGYGSALLAGRGGGSDSGGAHVVALDYDAATLAHAARRYDEPRFVRGNLAALPIRTGSADALVTLQVIEHVWDHGQFVAECLRVLRPGGLLAVSTPNRLTFSPGRDVPVNPFHTHEFTAAELTALLRRHGFGIEALLGVRASARLRELDDRYGGSFVDAQLGAPPHEWPAALRADVADVSSADFDVAAGEVDVSLDLLVLARPAAG